MAHTDATIKAVMQEELLETATVLNWTDVSNAGYNAALRRTLRRLNLATTEASTNDPLLETVATIEIWRSVANATVTAINFEADGGTFNRKDMHDHAVRMVKQLEAEFLSNQPVIVEEAPMSGTLDTFSRW